MPFRVDTVFKNDVARFSGPRFRYWAFRGSTGGFGRNGSATARVVASSGASRVWRRSGFENGKKSHELKSGERRRVTVSPSEETNRARETFLAQHRRRVASAFFPMTTDDQTSGFNETKPRLAI